MKKVFWTAFFLALVFASVYAVRGWRNFRSEGFSKEDVVGQWKLESLRMTFPDGRRKKLGTQDYVYCFTRDGKYFYGRYEGFDGWIMDMDARYSVENDSITYRYLDVDRIRSEKIEWMTPKRMKTVYSGEDTRVYVYRRLKGKR